jgi:hypothetical protein
MITNITEGTISTLDVCIQNLEPFGVSSGHS